MSSDFGEAPLEPRHGLALRAEPGAPHLTGGKDAKMDPKVLLSHRLPPLPVKGIQAGLKGTILPKGNLAAAGSVVQAGG